VKKFLTVLFTCYIITLSFMPCNDADDCVQENAIEHSSVNSDHAEHEGDTENCTPFCMCACCGQSYHFEYFPASLGFESAILVLEESKYQATFISGYACSIWKPPQLS
jgi:hypothetical protein